MFSFRANSADDRLISYFSQKIGFDISCKLSPKYKIMILLNTFSSEISWPISTKFHIDPTVETGLRVCSNGHTPLTVMHAHIW